MFSLQALQTNGTWYAISAHDTHSAAEDAMRERAGWRRGAVKYRIVRAA